MGTSGIGNNIAGQVSTGGNWTNLAYPVPGASTGCRGKYNTPRILKWDR